MNEPTLTVQDALNKLMSAEYYLSYSRPSSVWDMGKNVLIAAQHRLKNDMAETAYQYAKDKYTHLIVASSFFDDTAL